MKGNVLLTGNMVKDLFDETKGDMIIVKPVIDIYNHYSTSTRLILLHFNFSTTQMLYIKADAML